MRALFWAGFTFTTYFSVPVWIEANGAALLTGVQACEVCGLFALCAIVFSLAFVASAWTGLAHAAKVTGTFFVITILALDFAPTVVSQVGGIAAFLANSWACAQAAVFRT